LPPGGKAGGFVYFGLPDERENLLSRITLEVTARDQHQGSQAEYRFPLGQAAK
jgi:hypothetical protein